MSPPALNIRLELEAAPRVYSEALTDAEQARLWDWIGSQPELILLLAIVCELHRTEK